MNHRQKKLAALIITAMSVLFQDYVGGLFFEITACLSLFYLAVLAYKTNQHGWITLFGSLSVIFSPLFGGTPVIRGSRMLNWLPLPFSIIVLVVLAWAFFFFEIPEKIENKWV